MKNLRNKPLIFTLFRPPFFAKNRGPWRGVFGGPNHQNTNRFRGWQGVQNPWCHFCKKSWFLSMKNENLRNRFEDFLKFYENFIKKNDAFWGGLTGVQITKIGVGFPGPARAHFCIKKWLQKKGHFCCLRNRSWVDLKFLKIFENFSKFSKISKICKFRGPDPPTPTFSKWPQNLIVCSVKRVIFSKNWKFEKNTKNTLVHTRETHTYFGDFHSSWTPKMSLGKIWDFSGSEFKKRGKISVFVP